MTTKDLYKWATKHNIEDKEIIICIHCDDLYYECETTFELDSLSFVENCVVIDIED